MFLSTPFFKFSLDVYLLSVAVTDKILKYFVVYFVMKVFLFLDLITFNISNSGIRMCYQV